MPVFFVNGPDDAPFSRSDFDLDGDVDTSDYLTLQANHLKNLGGTLHIDTFDVGDINGDLVNDYLDFRMFKADFIAANGAAAFASTGCKPRRGRLSRVQCPADAWNGGRRFGFATDARYSDRTLSRVLQNQILPKAVTPRRRWHDFVSFSFVCHDVPVPRSRSNHVILETFDTRSDLTGDGCGGWRYCSYPGQSGRRRQRHAVHLDFRRWRVLRRRDSRFQLWRLSRVLEVRILARPWRTISCRLTSPSTPATASRPT